MSSETNEIKTYFGRCRCCLNYSYLKNMWEEHYWEGEKEIYVDMLVQCFALSWEQSDDSKDDDQICESCIKRLRDAYTFKKVVLESQEELLGLVDNESNVPVKIEKVDYTLVYKEKDGSRTADDGDYIDDPDDPDYIDPDDPEDNDDSADPNAMEYEEVEYLEDIDENRDALAAQVNTRTGRRSNTPTLAGSDGKWPRKLPKAARYKTYKQYTEEDLRKCVEAVRSEEMTSTEASEKFNIPKKTICAKIKIDPKGQFNDPYKTVNKEKMYQLIQEVKTILTYTNATPFKSKANKYYCAYCSTDGPHFDDPDELRTHTRIQHASDRTARIEYCMRPHWMNETIKLDIENLLCTVCSNSISSWNDMFRHLKDFHKIVLDQAYTRAIPYALRADLHCALCKEAFGNYMHLDGHMNAHYSNHVCDDCGDTFLAANRLKQHRKIHDIGKFACSICPKVFTLDKYKKKHEESVHKHLCKYKCWYCDEKFTAEYIRHVHTVDKHKEKVKTLTCEFCGKTFTWRPYYVAHKKKKHIVDAKKFSCEECDKKFFSQFELKEHKLRHTGVKHFPCHICQKRYISSGSLKHHLNWHKRNEAVDG